MAILVAVALLAFVMGVAIQRGTTCAVLAVEELLRHRRADRFLGFFECGLWAALSLSVLGAQPASALFESPLLSLLGGACLFGLGATLNGACAFGTIARLGNGRLEYLLTAATAWMVIAAISSLGWSRVPDPNALSNGVMAAALAVGLLVSVMLVRWRVRRRRLRSFVTLGALMAIIGVAGAMLAVIHQPWPWMNTLAALPDVGMASAVGLLALIFGAMASGVVGGQFRVSAPSATAIVRRIGGGALMGAGTALVPGGNDALILYGIPQGDARALGAYLVMLSTIAAALIITGGLPSAWRARGA
ncbi:YeeE/YedE thiosulfate transporter family protein [Salinisphaera sp. P385]|uniref:YeeE/YedE thiosulfate transporter family protein n=1 Tax=Spectribacter acetivorans TaxID=3075603 RepID=A0ABU3BCB3_9GAMM|nr:YeeE/YedE thiosulfate transporter family protein [Salinisphaera sp. P385]MDT0618616.1 YeeE/YedE thiosulfate transporter family protein [Salinisphaera sp. P385]